jgi:hypothetical protein
MNPAGATGDQHQRHPLPFGTTLMFKLAFAILFLIIAAMVVCAYFNFNPAIPVFIILGFGVYMVGRIGGPLLPADTKGTFDWSGTGVYIESQDFVTPDSDSHSGGHLRDGVDPNDPSNKRP